MYARADLHWPTHHHCAGMFGFQGVNCLLSFSPSHTSALSLPLSSTDRLQNTLLLQFTKLLLNIKQSSKQQQNAPWKHSLRSLDKLVYFVVCKLHNSDETRKKKWQFVRRWDKDRQTDRREKRECAFSFQHCTAELRSSLIPFLFNCLQASHSTRREKR